MLNLQQIAKTDPILLPTIFKSLEHNRVFRKAEYRESFLKNITNLLSLRESRHNALLMLNIFCDRHLIVNSPLITEKTCLEINLIDQLLKIIEQEPQYTEEGFKTVGKLVKITAYNPDTNKIVQSKYITKIIDAIVGSTASPRHSLDCLAICFEHHGGTSGIFKNKIYDYCVSFIDIPDSEIALRIGYCLHLLQQSRGGSVGGGVYKKCWAEFHGKNLGSLETLLDQIFKQNSGKSLGKSEQLQLPELELSPQPFNMYTQMYVRFKNLVAILKVSLRRSFTMPKTIQVSRIINFVEEGIAMSQAVLAKKAITESMVLTLLHGQIHMNLLEVLKSLILCVKQNICTHSKAICDLLWRCLKQTNGNEQMKFEANLKLRVATYETFMCFMRISPNNVHVKNVMENLMKEALVDVTPASDKICLMMPQKSAGNTNKKKLNTDKITKGRGHIANMSDEQTVCAAALECLGVLLMDQGVLMKPVLFFLMQEKITSIAFKTFSRTQLDGDLYRDPICRTNLADLIGFMMQYPVNKMPVPINYGINILTKVKEYDPSQKVRATAAKNLSQAEMTIHNKKDVFYFPVEYKDLKDTLMFNKQTIQKFVEANAQKEVNGSNQSNVIEIEDEAMEQSENIVISDNESEKQVAEKADEELNPPPADEINEISDESEPEKESEVMAPTHEISDDEQVENVEEPEKLPEPVKTAAISSPRKSARNAKRSSPPAPVKTSPKKQKKSGKDDEELVNEMLADFNE